MPDEFALSCPAPAGQGSVVELAHGGGGRRMRRLIEDLFLKEFSHPALAVLHDSAVVRLPPGRVALTTDGYVVQPLFFPGGDIGKLAVCGTVNDLAMAGARPLYLTAGFVLEEGLPIETLERAVRSMARAAEECGVAVIAGDTKVVDRGKGDGIFITTAGVGVIAEGVDISPASVRPGDAIFLSGDLGRHGIAILSCREGLEFEGALESDCAPLAAAVAALLDAGIEVHCLRDLTRGGLGAALCEIAAQGGIGMEVDEEAIPVSEPVRGACEILGLDPLYVANEGRFAAFLPEAEARRALEVLQAQPAGAGAAAIGRVTAAPRGTVVLRGALGQDRVLDLPSGEQLPRIC
jgi:hydrogenase expression/formation protein HypE